MKKLLSILLSVFVLSCQAQTLYVRTNQLPKKVTDILAAKIVAGANVTVTVNPTTGTITIASTGGGGGGASGVTLFQGRSGTVVGVEDDYSAFYPRLSQVYTNPPWLASIPWSKVTGSPSFITTSSPDVLSNKTIDGSTNTISNVPLASVVSLVSSLSGKEPTITVLTPARGGTGITTYTAGSYINALNSTTLQQRTVAQMRADLLITNLDNTSDATKNSATATLTNKTISFANNTATNIPYTAIPGLSTDLALKANLTDFGVQTEITLTPASGAATWNLATSVNAKIALTGNVVITLQNFGALYAPALRITQTGSLGYSITFVSAGNTIWYSGGVSGNRLSTVSGYRGLYVLRKAGTEIEASLSNDYTTTP